jgi:hypothetical protein
MAERTLTRKLRLTKKWIFCIYLPILCGIALIAGLIVAHVRESSKLSAEEKPGSPQTSHYRFATTHPTITTQTFVHPSTVTLGSSKITTRVTSKIVKTFERTEVTETSIRPHVTTINTAASSSKFPQNGPQSASTSTATSTAELAQSEPQSPSTTSISTMTIPTTATIFKPPQESPKQGTAAVSQGISKAVSPNSPNDGAQDPQVAGQTGAQTSLDTATSSPILSPVGSSVIIPVSSTFSETPNTKTLGTSKVLVNPVSQPATTFSTATTNARGAPTITTTSLVSSTTTQSKASPSTTTKTQKPNPVPKFLFKNDSAVLEVANAAIVSK